jgi:hypothetical protein
MAKKKKSHARSGGRGSAKASASTATTASKSTSGALFTPETVKPTPATPGGPNRLARKEEARKERERIRRKIARRRLYRRSGQVAIALLVVAALIFLLTRPKAKLNAEEQQLLSEGSAPATLTAAGCDAVQTIPPYSPDSADRTHIGAAGYETAPALSTYSSVPPASGPHNSTPLTGGVYADPPDIYQTIHSLEHGAAIIWYDPSAPAAELATLQTFFQKPGEHDKVIVAPYSFPNEGDAGALPAGKLMVMVAWHRMQTCDSLSLPVAYAFVHGYSTGPKSDYKGEAPEETAPI